MLVLGELFELPPRVGRGLDLGATLGYEEGYFNLQKVHASESATSMQVVKFN